MRKKIDIENGMPRPKISSSSRTMAHIKNVIKTLRERTSDINV